MSTQTFTLEEAQALLPVLESLLRTAIKGKKLIEQGPPVQIFERATVARTREFLSHLGWQADLPGAPVTDFSPQPEASR